MHTYEKMDPQIKAWWIEALRSGKYTQGRSRLKQRQDKHNKTVVTHCCLGVLCEVLVEQHHPFTASIHISDSTITVSGVHEGFPNTQVTGILSDDLAEALHLLQHAEVSDYFPANNNIMLLLAQHNDCNGADRWDFNQIAEWVEANL